MTASFVRVKGVTLLVCCYINRCLIYNQNGSRMLYKTELVAEDKQDLNNIIWFSSVSTAYSGTTGEEFLALATSDGRILRIDVEGGGANFTKEVGFTMGL